MLRRAGFPRAATARRRSSRSSTPIRATSCSRSRGRPLRDRDRHPRARRAPARPPVRAPRRVRALPLLPRVVPRDRFNTQNRVAHLRRSSASAFGGHGVDWDAAPVRVRARADPLHRAHRRRASCPTTTSRRSRAAGEATRAGPTTCATRCSRSRGGARQQLFRRYGEASRRLPRGLAGRSAVADIRAWRSSPAGDGLGCSLYRPLEAAARPCAASCSAPASPRALGRPARSSSTWAWGSATSGPTRSAARDGAPTDLRLRPGYGADAELDADDDGARGLPGRVRRASGGASWRTTASTARAAARA